MIFTRWSWSSDIPAITRNSHYSKITLDTRSCIQLRPFACGEIHGKRNSRRDDALFGHHDSLSPSHNLHMPIHYQPEPERQTHAEFLDVNDDCFLLLRKHNRPEHTVATHMQTNKQTSKGYVAAPPRDAIYSTAAAIRNTVNGDLSRFLQWHTRETASSLHTITSAHGLHQG
jgi:hypothetical protein